MNKSVCAVFELARMEFWCFVVVLFAAVIAGGRAKGLQNDTLGRSANRMNEPCRRLYSFRNLEYENLEKSSASQWEAGFKLRSILIIIEF